LSSVTSAVRVDQGFNLVKLASELRGIRPSDISFSTVPIASMAYQTPDGQQAVLWNTAQAAALFRWLKTNTGPAGKPKASRQSRLSRSKVNLEVYNGTQLSGLSTTTGQELSALGFHVVRAGLNWSSDTVARTVIQYPPGQSTAATVLAKVLHGSAVQQVAGLPRIRLILGSTGHTVAGTSSASGGNGASPTQQHTAAQDACRSPGKH